MLKVGIYQPGHTSEKNSSILQFIQEPSMMPFQKRVKSQEQSFFWGQKLPFFSGSKLPSLAQLNLFGGACHTGQELKPKTLTTLVKTPS